VRHFEYSNAGGYSVNEDSVGCREGLAGCCFALADGLGGQGHGDVASQAAVELLLKGAVRTRQDVARAFEVAQRGVEGAQQWFPGARSTGVLLALRDGAALWGHVGDSRLYRFTRGRLAHVTADHSVSYMKHRSGAMDHNAIALDEDRSGLLRALGGKQSKPDIGVAPLRPGDDAFLLCSDGFWEYLRDEEILIDLLKSATPREWAEHMLLRHIRRARPGNDNYSLIAVFA